MLSNDIIEKCEDLLVKLSGNHDAGHDLSHIRRVRKNALLINQTDNIADPVLIELCAMFHDVGDHKFNTEPEKVFSSVTAFLRSEGFGNETISAVLYVAENISFSKGENRGDITPTLAVVMDADRLDAMGAVGIARAFTYGGFKNRPMYNEKGHGSTIYHFHEKLLRLKGMMNTPAGSMMAAQRHDFMVKFLEEFEREAGIIMDFPHH